MTARYSHLNPEFLGAAAGELDEVLVSFVLAFATNCANNYDPLTATRIKV
jgi:hypothetical protein